jgi:hypothetical protein
VAPLNSGKENGLEPILRIDQQVIRWGGPVSWADYGHPGQTHLDFQVFQTILQGAFWKSKHLSHATRNQGGVKGHEFTRAAKTLEMNGL